MGLRHQLARKPALDWHAPVRHRLPLVARRSDAPLHERDSPAARSSICASVIGHIAALGLGLMFAGANPFDAVPLDAIAIDIVSSDEVPSPSSSPSEPSKSVPPSSGDPLFTESVPSSAGPTPGLMNPPEPTARPAPMPPAQGGHRSTPQNAKQVASRPPASEQAALKPLPSEAVPARPAFPLQIPPPEPAAVPTPDVKPPDFTDMFGLPVTLPGGQLGGGFDAPAYDAAKLSGVETAVFRNHLKSCGSLPGGISPDDKVRIVLRVSLAPNGALTGEPTLIEASANAKGPLLMQSAINALRRCAPYTMLPPDRYDEWKILDLSFTPHDLTGG